MVTGAGRRTLGSLTAKHMACYNIYSIYTVHILLMEEILHQLGEKKNTVIYNPSLGIPTVDGSEIPNNQSMLVVYPKALYISTGAGFLNHQHIGSMGPTVCLPT